VVRTYGQYHLGTGGIRPDHQHAVGLKNGTLARVAG
jgi:hypothetical protein